MQRGNDFLRRLCDKADLMDTALPNRPLLELIGCGRLVIENHKGVVRYDSDCIAVSMDFGQVLLKGNALELTRMSPGQLIITGRLEQISLLRRDC